MKTKIISFIFLMAFMTIAINCKPDPIPSRPSHKYTIEEVKQIRENLVGTYRGVIDGQDARLEIEANRSFLFIINRRILSSGNYTMNFFLITQLH